MVHFSMGLWLTGPGYRASSSAAKTVLFQGLDVSNSQRLKSPFVFSLHPYVLPPSYLYTTSSIFAPRRNSLMRHHLPCENYSKTKNVHQPNCQVSFCYLVMLHAPVAGGGGFVKRKTKKKVIIFLGLGFFGSSFLI